MLSARPGLTPGPSIHFHSSASLRLEDAYLHVPGHTPSQASEDSALFRQRPDDPSVLPSLRRHQWGHLLALGNLTLKIEKTISSHSQSGVAEKEKEGVEDEKIEEKDSEEVETLSSDSGARVGGGWREGGEGGANSRCESDVWSWRKVVSVLGSGEPGVLTGEGSSLMVEWSRPTQVALLRTLSHLKQHYRLFGGGTAVAARSNETGQWTVQEGQTVPVSSPLQSAQDDEGNDGVSVGEGAGLESVSGPVDEDNTITTIGSVLHSLSKMTLSFHFTDANAFIYGLTPSMYSWLTLIQRQSVVQ